MLQRILLVAICLGLAWENSVITANDELPVIRNQIIRKPAKPDQPGNTLSLEQSDQKALESANIKRDDEASLINYLKSRTVNDTDLSKIQTLITQLGDASFPKRIEAELALERIGLPAITALKTAAANSNADAEIQFRAKACLKRIETIPQADLASAVVRALAQFKTKTSLEALLAYSPLADNATVLEEILRALTASAFHDGKINPTVLDALSSDHPIRRSLAASALLEGMPQREADVVAKVVAAAKTEKDFSTKFAMAQKLVIVAKENTGIDLLLESIPELNRGQIWQLEDLLAQIAIKDPPKTRFLKTRDSLVKAQTAWKEWWNTNQKSIDLAKMDVKQRIQGCFVTISHSYVGQQVGIVTEYGPDEKMRWQVSGMLYPTAVEFVSNDKFWVADQNASTVTLRDLTGRVLQTRQFTIDNGGWQGPAQPTNIKLLENGNLFVVARNGFCEFDSKGKEVLKYTRTQQVQGWGNQDVVSACKLQSGEFAVQVMNNGPNGQNPQIIFVGKDGKEIKVKDKENKEITKFIKTSYANNFGGSMIETSKNKVLICENNRLVEYDLETGKTGWVKQTNNPRCIQKLPNGNIIYFDGNTGNKIVEITPEGEEVWSFVMREPNVNLYRLIVR